MTYQELPMCLFWLFVQFLNQEFWKTFPQTFSRTFCPEEQKFVSTYDTVNKELWCTTQISLHTEYFIQHEWLPQMYNNFPVNAAIGKSSWVWPFGRLSVLTMQYFVKTVATRQYWVMPSVWNEAHFIKGRFKCRKLTDQPRSVRSSKKELW